MSDRTFFKDIDGTQVFINSDGKFEAKIGGRLVKKGSLREIEKELEKLLSPLKVYELDKYGHPRRPNPVEIIKFESDGRARERSGELVRYREAYYLLGEKELDSIQSFVDRQDKLKEDWKGYIESLTRVTKQNFEELRKKAPKPSDPAK